jgi:large subunit ribosomal protein L20
MSRVNRGFKARHRRNKILQLAKGYVLARRRLFRTAVETVQRALVFAYRDRKVRKREFRKLWVARINAAARENGLNYSRFIDGLSKIGIALNRKMLAELAATDPKTFSVLASTVKNG